MNTEWEVNWSSSGDEIADYYNVYKQVAGGSLQFVTSGRTTRAIVELPNTGEVALVYVAPVIDGKEIGDEEWTKIEIRPNDLSDIPRPGDVTNFVVSQDGDFINARWDAVSDPHLDHYEIRRGATWDVGIKVATAAKGVTSARWGWMGAGSGSTNYVIKAISKQKQSSANEGSAAVTIVEPLDVVEVTTTTEDPTFGGTKTGTEVDSGNLIPEQRATLWSNQTTPALWSDWTGAPWWWKFEQDPTYTTPAQDNGAVVDEVPHIDVTLSPVEKVGMTWDQWHGPTVRGEIDDTDDAGGPRTPFDETEFDYLEMEAGDLKLKNGVEMKIDIQMAQDGVPTWGTAERWIPGTRYRYRQVRFIITLITRVPWWYPSISALTWRLFRRNFKQEKKVTITVTGGTVVTWDKSFSATPVVVPGAVYNAAGRYATVEGISATQATVRIFDPAGTETTGDVEVHALGY